MKASLLPGPLKPHLQILLPSSVRARGRADGSGQQPLTPAQHHSAALSLKKYPPQPPSPTKVTPRCPPLSKHSVRPSITPCTAPYLVHAGLLDAGAQVLHAGVDVPLRLQLGFHARQVAAPLCPLQPHLKQAKRSKSSSCRPGVLSQTDTRARKPPRSLKRQQIPHRSWQKVPSPQKTEGLTASLQICTQL